MVPIIADESRVTHGSYSVAGDPLAGRDRNCGRTAVDRGAQVIVDVAGDGLTPALAYVPLVGAPEPGDRAVLNTTALRLVWVPAGTRLSLLCPIGYRPTHRVQDISSKPATPRPRPPCWVLTSRIRRITRQSRRRRRWTACRLWWPICTRPCRRSSPARCSIGRAPASPYVLTDGGALPLWYSHTLADLRGLLCGTVSTGQAFGGDLEAVTVHTGLAGGSSCSHCGHRSCCSGTGQSGDQHPVGFSGVAAGEVVNAVGVLGGRPVGALRISDADPRERHREFHTTLSLPSVG